MSAHLADIATPCLVVDVAVLERNVRNMAEHAGRAGVRLRPHAKTHKSPEIARRQVAAGARGLTVATLSEAEVFAEAGFRDLFVAYPLWVDRAKGRRLRALLDTATLTIGVDSLEGAQALAAQLGADRDRVAVLVEVDSGHGRSGTPPEQAGSLADRVCHTGLSVRGVFTFPGHSYTPGRREGVAAQEAGALGTAARSLAGSGIEPATVSGGSTPTATLVGGSAMTEMRPGVYVFGDAQQLELGAMPAEAIALTALGTVVSHAGGRVVLDSGSKVIGADRAPWATGHGRLLDHPDARVTQLSEHHAVVTWRDDGPLPEVGSRLRVVPNHVCNAVNLVDELVACENGAVVDRWVVAGRGANT